MGQMFRATVAVMAGLAAVGAQAQATQAATRACISEAQVGAVTNLIYAPMFQSIVNACVTKMPPGNYFATRGKAYADRFSALAAAQRGDADLAFARVSNKGLLKGVTASNSSQMIGAMMDVFINRYASTKSCTVMQAFWQPYDGMPPEAFGQMMGAMMAMTDIYKAIGADIMAQESQNLKKATGNKVEVEVDLPDDALMGLAPTRRPARSRAAPRKVVTTVTETKKKDEFAELVGVMSKLNICQRPVPAEYRLIPPPMMAPPVPPPAAPPAAPATPRG